MKPVDITNMKFGELKALNVEIKNKKRGWNCICSCGSHKWVETYRLLNDKIKHCGHYLHKLEIKEGDIFGELTIMENIRDSKNKRYL